MSEPIIPSVIPAQPGPWVDRFHDLPIFQTPPGVLMPQYDGDMAQLYELRDRIFNELAIGGRIPFGPHFGEIHHHVVRQFGIDNSLFYPSINPWPVDQAAELLAAWRTGEQAAA